MSQSPDSGLLGCGRSSMHGWTIWKYSSPSRKGADVSANSKATIVHQPQPRLQSWAEGKARL